MKSISKVVAVAATTVALAAPAGVANAAVNATSIDVESRSSVSAASTVEGSAAMNQGAEPRGCRLYARDPFRRNDGWLVGRGGRLGCGNRVAWVDVKLWKDVPLGKDRLVAEKRFRNAKNFWGAVYGKCYGHGKYYVSTHSSKGTWLEGRHMTMC